MYLKLITKENFNYALKLQNEIFPEYNGKNNYLDSLKDNSKIKFYLIYVNDLCVGITGIYSYKDDRDNAWLGFFGIKEEYRNKGYGKLALKLTEEYAIKFDFKFMRLFTDKLDNDLAINFYKGMGYEFEDYSCKEESANDKFLVVIGSKSLTGLKLEKWNNKFLNITKQISKQNYD